ncbi:MAG: fructose-6-phosphate aldolase, partial [Deltaproteobacteria bacterium]|nr:fructose-6-phosphate aldolase [Deltaproteobacteria bacterium]
MKFFLDSAKLEEIEKAKDLPYFAGVTTNPILLERAKIKDREKFYESVLSLIPKKELFVQVFSEDEERAY